MAKIGFLDNMKSESCSFMVSILFQLKIQAKLCQFLILQAEKCALMRANLETDTLLRKFVYFTELPVKKLELLKLKFSKLTDYGNIWVI